MSEQQAPYQSEPDKSRPYIEKYLKGVVYDIACGDSKVLSTAIGIDGRPLPGVDIVRENLNQLSKDLIPADTIYSSNFLEHCPESYSYIEDWSKILKSGGFLLLYLPDGHFYSHENNPEHLQWTEYKTFLFWFQRTFCGTGKNFKGQPIEPVFQIVDAGTDCGEENHYCFYIAAQKL